MTPDGRLQVKDTNLANVRRGDIFMWRAGDLLWPDWDVLGGLIRTFEGNQGTARDPRVPGHGSGDYTHGAWCVHPPHPEAVVVEVSDRPGIFRIEDGATWKEDEILPGRWAEEPICRRERLRSKMPIRLHATWPKVCEETVDLENPHMEVWRLRRATPEVIEGILKLAADMIGWQYDLAQFLTLGNLLLPGAQICSEFVKDPAYNASMLLTNEFPICLTPDLAGNADRITTPNDLINAEEMFRVSFQGLRA
jgi:hypothetical protein